MHNDFLGEIVSEQARTGKTGKPNPANPVTMRRRQLANTIQRQAQEFDEDPAIISMEYVRRNTPDLQRYVTLKGEIPRSNPAELALQAFMLRDAEAQQAADIIGCSKEEAHVWLDQAESRSEDMNSSEADNFIGAIFDAVANVAQKGIEKIKEKRAANGKKPGIWGVLSPGTPTAYPQASTGGGGLKVLAGDVLDAIKESEKKKEINKMLPQIVIGIAVLIIVVVLITRYASKR